VLRAPLTRDHLALISGIMDAGRLRVQMQDHACNGAAIVGFLRQLLRRLDRSLIVIWDGAPIHHDHQVKEFLGASGVHLERLPGYAPDLNPDEALWQQLKHGELANVKGVRTISMPSATKTASKLDVNLASRSRIKKRIDLCSPCNVQVS